MYSPINLNVFTAAYSGALAGMGVSGRTPSDPNSGDYATIASTVGAYAQAFDINWGSAPASALALESIQEMSEGNWAGRTPPNANGQVPATYNTEVQAIIAIVNSGGTYFATQGIVPQSVPVAESLSQGVWFIDALLGNDSNDGKTALTALKTDAQLQSRLGKSAVLIGQVDNSLGFPINLVTVNILNNMPQTDPINVDLTLPANSDGDGGLVYIGKATTVLTGVIAAVPSVANRVTNTRWSITDPLVVWGPFVEGRLRIVGGPNDGVTAIIVKDLGANTAVISSPVLVPPVSPSANVASAISNAMMAPGIISPGDSYVVETFTKAFLNQTNGLSNASIITNLGSVLGFANLDFQIVDGLGVSLADANSITGYVECKFTGIARLRSISNIGVVGMNCCFRRGIQCQSSRIDLLAGVSFRNAVAVRVGKLACDFDFMVQGFSILVGSDSQLLLGTACVFDSAKSGVIVGGVRFGGSGAFASVEMDDESLGIHALWGSGNANRGLFVGNNGSVLYQSTPPSIVGALGEFALGNPTGGTARAFDEAAGVYTAPIAETYANLVIATPAGFGEAAVDVTHQASLAKFLSE